MDKLVIEWHNKNTNARYTPEDEQRLHRICEGCIFGGMKKHSEEIERVEYNAVSAVCIADDEIIESAMMNIPKKYITYSNEDKTDVLELYSAVRNVMIEQDYKKIDYPSSIQTSNLLQKIKYNLNTNSRSIT